jgi:hypothetical protein
MSFLVQYSSVVQLFIVTSSMQPEEEVIALQGPRCRRPLLNQARTARRNFLVALMSDLLSARVCRSV